MSIFGGFTKPGPGIDKNAPKKKGIFLYADIFINKFWKIVQANLLYFVTSLPIIVIYYIMAPVTSEFVTALVPDAASDASVMATAQMGFRSMFTMSLFILWGSGPATAAYTFIMRSFVRAEHAWIPSDFFAKFKANFKQGIAVAAVDVIIVFLSYTAIPFYYVSYINSGSAIWLALCYSIGLALLIYTFIHYYIYQLMITFECSISQLYRNSIIMAFAKLPMNLLFTALALVLIYLVFMINPMLAIGVTALIWASMAIFPVIFYTTRVIQKNFLDQMPKSDTEDEDVEKICSDELIIGKDNDNLQ